MSAATTTAIVIPNIDRPHVQYPITHPATLTPTDPGHDLPPVYLITVDAETARHYGCSRMAGQIIGGITRTSRGWASVAYRDRDAWLAGADEGHFIPVDAKNRAQAVRMLLFFWHIHHHPDHTTDMITDADWKRR